MTAYVFVKSAEKNTPKAVIAGHTSGYRKKLFRLSKKHSFA